MSGRLRDELKLGVQCHQTGLTIAYFTSASAAGMMGEGCEGLHLSIGTRLPGASGPLSANQSICAQVVVQARVFVHNMRSACQCRHHLSIHLLRAPSRVLIMCHENIFVADRHELCGKRVLSSAHGIHIRSEIKALWPAPPQSAHASTSATTLP